VGFCSWSRLLAFSGMRRAWTFVCPIHARRGGSGFAVRQLRVEAAETVATLSEALARALGTSPAKADGGADRPTQAHAAAGPAAGKGPQTDGPTDTRRAPQWLLLALDQRLPVEVGKVYGSLKSAPQTLARRKPLCSRRPSPDFYLCRVPYFPSPVIN
jgi:hypothetical protein